MVGITQQQVLQGCALFGGMAQTDLQAICSQGSFLSRSFSRDEVVAFEEDPCSSIGIVAAGSIHIQRLFPSGKIITLETFFQGDSFGEALVFSDRADYPATLVAREDTQVMYIPRSQILDLCALYPQFMTNFLRALSNKLLLLNRKIKNLSFGSVRQKVANFLIEESRRQNTSHLTIGYRRSELADQLGIPRPSLSRELVAMKDMRWIDFNRNTVSILNITALSQALDE